jgi:CcmD family protein
MPSRIKKLLCRTLPAVAMLLVFAGVTAAQESGAFPQAGAMGQQSLRPYWHVFIAYAIAVVFILGWVVSIARRLSALERRLTAD